jgi:Tol biopolymer transport system component
VAAALTDHPMHRMDTADMTLYFPEGREDQAARFLERVEGCARYEKGLARVHNGVSDAKMVVILPELAFNNAFVAARLEGYETVGVVPTYNTTDLFMLEGGIPPDPAIIGCHEITHYVHLQQVAGFAWFVNTLFGQVYTPQEGLDSWFDEGLAVFYETKLQPGVGRLSWPFWHGAFAAGMAGHRINGGDLAAANRDFFGGNHYLVGSEFVSFLAGRYGEQKLWDLIAVQARSILFPLAVNVRFWQAYDHSLSSLIDQFADDVAAHDPVRLRPSTQRTLAQVGDSVRYGRAGDGTQVLLASDHDLPSRLIVLGPDGRTLAERDLTDVVPPRRLVTSSPRLSGTPTFTADGKTVFFVAIDQDATYQVARLMRYDIPEDVLSVAHPDLKGAGGAISPDGTRYLFPYAAGDHHDLAELDLRSGAVRVLAPQPPRGYLAGPRFSPDGRRLSATVYDGTRFGIAVLDAATGVTLAKLPTGGGPVHEASWADDHRLVYLGTSPEDWRFQVYVHDLTTGGTTKVTEAPYLAFEPQAAGGHTVRFLNREGWHWTLDEVDLPPAVPAASPTRQPGPAAAEAEAQPAAAGPEAANPLPAEAGAAPAPVDEAAPPPTAPAAPAPAPVPDVPPPLPPAVSVGLPPPAVLATRRPASALDHLFVPSLIAPTTYAGPDSTLLGVVMSGADHLERHRWTVAGLYQFEGHLGSGSFGYANRQLAPVTIELAASQISTRRQPPQVTGLPGGSDLLYQRDREALLDVQRSIFGNPVGAGFQLVERTQRGNDLFVPLFPFQRFAGPYAFASYAGVESTSYGGTRRALAVDLYGAMFPADLTTAPNAFADLRGQLALAVPIPPLRRDRLVLAVRGRGLAGLPASHPLLQVGGTLPGMLWTESNRAEVDAGVPTVLALQVPFSESLRGFEDHELATNRIFIADLTYHYPFIIDWGSASTFGVLPAFFLRQFDLNLFATAATTGEAGDRHASAGGSLGAAFVFGPAPLSLRYQLARRLTDDRGVVMFVLLGT